MIYKLIKYVRDPAGPVPRKQSRVIWAAQTPWTGKKGCVTTPRFITIVDLQQGPS